MGDRSDREEITKKKAKVVSISMIFLTILNLAVIGYAGASFYSIMRTNVNVEDDAEYQYNINNILDPNDDTIDYYINVTIQNDGIFPIKFINLKVDIYILNSTDETLLPPGKYFGTLIANYTNIPPGNHTEKKLKVAIVADIATIVGLKTNDCWFNNTFSISTQVQYFPINVSGQFFTEYKH